MSGASCPVLLGPTAVGKTALVIGLAHQFPLEIISLDSRQIYRGMRIGTAQPTEAEQAACPHHLVDFVSPDSTYSAARYREDFARVYAEICARNHWPLLVGGAGFYLNGLREGFPALPEPAAAQTASVRAELELLNDEQIRTLLKACDPQSWQRIHANDRYRNQRALELYRLSGQPASELLETHQPDPCLGLHFPSFQLVRPPDELKARIEARTASMLAAGWLAETEGLLATHGAEAPGLQTLGYREIIQHLQGILPRADLADLISLRTAQYAKRQRTWFRQTITLDAGHPDDPEMLARLSCWLDSLCNAQ